MQFVGPARGYATRAPSVPPASTVTSAGGVAGVTPAGGDTAAWPGVRSIKAPAAPPRWRGGLNGTTRIISEPSPRVNPAATPGSTVFSAGVGAPSMSVGATPHSRARGHSALQVVDNTQASRRRRLV